VPAFSYGLKPCPSLSRKPSNKQRKNAEKRYDIVFLTLAISKIDIEKNQYLMREANDNLYLIISDKSRSACDVENSRDDHRIFMPYPRSSLNSMASLLSIRCNFAMAEITCAERDRLRMDRL